LGQSFSRLPHAWIEATDVPDVDWVARFREGFRGFACGSFWITPAWDVPKVPPPGRKLLIVDPGRAFGTGTHETTRLCLAALEALSPPGDAAERLLDLGTGTGILAVAGALLGWQHVVAADVDPECMEAVRLHARLNAVAIRPALADGGAAFGPGSFAVVVANLSAPLLVQRCSEIGGLAAPGGIIVLSGLLAADLAPVVRAYSAAGGVETTLDGEWARVMVRVPR
jgi:ribosomal protein L11 methyltransferase